MLISSKKDFICHNSFFHCYQKTTGERKGIQVAKSSYFTGNILPCPL